MLVAFMFDLMFVIVSDAHQSVMLNELHMLVGISIKMQLTSLGETYGWEWYSS